MKIDFEGAGPGYKSYCGAFVSISFIVMVSIFVYAKFLNLLNDSEIKISTSTIDGYFDQSKLFTSENGLFFAAALTAYDNETE